MLECLRQPLAYFSGGLEQCLRLGVADLPQILVGMFGHTAQHVVQRDCLMMRVIFGILHPVRHDNVPSLVSTSVVAL